MVTVAEGRGGSLGRALLNAIADAAGGVVGRLKSYTLKGWHPQLRKLTEGPKGYQAAAKAGLSATPRTLTAWLAEQQTPNAANQAKIQQAYDIMAGEWPEGIERRKLEISGEVTIGGDVRTRGSEGRAPLRINGASGDWSSVRRQWESGSPDPDQVEDDFADDVIGEDISGTSEAMEFDGSSYTVVIA